MTESTAEASVPVEPTDTHIIPGPAAPTDSNVILIDPTEYRRGNGYYFISPSGKWQCAILSGPDVSAGCHGPIPAIAPPVPSAGPASSGTHPNTIALHLGAPAEFLKLDSAPYRRNDNTTRTLPYGSHLAADEIDCSVSEETGVTCTDTTGHGFTLSNTAFELF